MGLPTNGAKRGRPSSLSLQGVLEEKRRKGPSQAIPSKNVRTDQISHWAIWVDKQQRCKYPGCKGYTLKLCSKCKVSLCDTKLKQCFYKYHNE